MGIGGMTGPQHQTRTAAVGVGVGGDIETDNKVCLVCGRHGGNSVIVTSVHSFVSASGMPLSDFLVKVVGEDPCYSVSDVVCQQCFVLLDRLDTYQARAAEIHTHISARFQETKMELQGHRQRMSELITSSLTNVNEMKNGTKLNVNNELTITVVHESLPKKSPKFFRLQKDLTFPSYMTQPTGVTSHLYALYSQSQQQAQRSQAQQSQAIIETAKLKRKLPDVARDSYTKRKRDSDVSDSPPPKPTTDEKPSSDDDDDDDDDKDDDDSDSDSGSDDSEEEEGEEEEKTEEEEEEEKGEEEEKEEEEEEESVTGVTSRPESSLSRTSQAEEYHHKPPQPQLKPQPQPQKKKTSATKIKAESKDVGKETNVETGEGVDPQVAEAMLMQSPLATSLLQSFLATSMWLGSQDTPPKNQHTQKQRSQVVEDVTSETLAVAAGSTRDKKMRQELKNTGQSYINTKGKLVDAKRVWPQDCSRCPLKCNARIPEEERGKIFGEYWGLADYNLQREYLAAHMQREEKLGPSGMPRTVILYFLTSSTNTKLQVCRQFFLKTLDVSEKASRIVLEKMVRGELGVEASTPAPSTSTSAKDERQLCVGVRWRCDVNVGEAKLTSVLRQYFPQASEVQVQDISGGCGAMYEVWVEDSSFKGLSRVKQHKLITQALKMEIKDMHGLRITTSTPPDS